MIEMKGTRRQIIQGWIDAYERMPGHGDIDKEVFEKLFDLMLEQSSSFSQDEAFVILNEKFDSRHRLLTPNAEYYISVCRSTWFMFNVIVKLYFGNELAVALFTAEEMLLAVAPDNPVNGNRAPFIYHIDDKEKGCIMLEAFRNRRGGIDENVLRQYNGECGHAELGCRYMERETGKCNCKVKNVKEALEELAEKHLLMSKRRKYYYNDIL